MAYRAADRAKQRAPIGDRGSSTRIGGRGRRRSQRAHEDRETRDVARYVRVLLRLVGARRYYEVGRVFGGWIDAAVARKAGRPSFAGDRALLSEDFVGDAHFHVVSFTGK